MEVKASVDIGQNITSLIEKLAQQIGTTTDKVFPWYVKQQIIEGYTYLAIGAAAMILSIIMLSVSWKKSDFDNGNLYAVFVVVSLVLLFGSGIFFLFGTTGAVSQIVNPQYHALHAMTQDMAKLLNR